MGLQGVLHGRVRGENVGDKGAKGVHSDGMRWIVPKKPETSISFRIYEEF